VFVPVGTMWRNELESKCRYICDLHLNNLMEFESLPHDNLAPICTIPGQHIQKWKIHTFQTEPNAPLPIGSIDKVEFMVISYHVIALLGGAITVREGGKRSSDLSTLACAALKRTPPIFRR
jgi:hypothetical protein